MIFSDYDQVVNGINGDLQRWVDNGELPHHEDVEEAAAEEQAEPEQPPEVVDFVLTVFGYPESPEESIGTTSVLRRSRGINTERSWCVVMFG